MSERVPIDLHVHSCLSPCAEEEMRPPAVLLTAERRGIRVLGMVDHSTAGNAPAFWEAAAAFAVRVLVGMEVESAEGVHILALFDSPDAAGDMAAEVAEHLPPLLNRPQLMGRQLRVDAWGTVLGEEPRLLICAADLSLDRLVELTHARGGLSIAAHVDRAAWGLLPTLGFVPPDLGVDLLEVSPALTPAAARRRWPELAAWPLVQSSDAHCLEDVGRAPTLVSRELAESDLPLPQWAARLAAELGAGRGEV